MNIKTDSIVLNQYFSLLFISIEDDLIVRGLLMKQIQHLNIDVKEQFPSLSNIGIKIFRLISSLCKKLTTCNFGDVYLPHKCVIPACRLSYEDPILSNLVQLKINLEWLPDCIYFLDGRFESLSTVIIHVTNIDQTINWQKAVSRISPNERMQLDVILFFFSRNNFPS